MRIWESVEELGSAGSLVVCGGWSKRWMARMGLAGSVLTACVPPSTPCARIVADSALGEQGLASRRSVTPGAKGYPGQQVHDAFQVKYQGC
jgi:hypothetical protein